MSSTNKICLCGVEILVRIYNTNSGIKTYHPKYCSRQCAYSLRVRPSGLDYKIVAQNKGWFKSGVSRIWGTHTEETKQKLSQLLKGKRLSPATEFKYKNGNGYRHLLYKGILPQYCVCGEENIQRLHVHHKDKNRKNNKIDNLEVLCRPCHLAEHNKIERNYVLGRKKVYG